MHPTLTVTTEQIDKIFAEAKNQGEYIVGVYRLAHKDFDDIERFDSHPTCSRTFSEYIFKKAIRWDQLNEPELFNGGAWMNYGFAVDDSLDGMTVRPCERVTYKTTSVTA